MVRLKVGEEHRPRRAAAPARRDPVHPQRHGVHPRHVPGPRRHPRGLPGLRGARGPDRVLRRRDRAADDAAPADRRGGHRGHTSCYIFPATHYVAGPERMERAITGIELELEDQLAELREAGQAARGAAAADAHDVRRRDDAPGRLLLRHRELLDAHRRPPAAARRPTACSTTSPRTSCSSSTSRTSPCRRSAACTKATCPASATWSTTASGCRARWTTGRCAGRSSSSGSARRSTSPRPRATTSWPRSAGDVVEQIIRPTGLVDPEVIVKPTKGQIDDLIHEINDPHREERAGPGHHADQEDVRGPHRLPPRGRHPHPLPAQRGRHAAPDRAAPRAAAGGVRRPGRHQPAARGPRPARGVAGGDPRRRQGGLPALRQVADPDHRPRRPQRVRPGRHVRRQDHRRRWRRRSTRPTGAARSRSPTTRPHGVDPQPLRKKIADITEMLAREDEDTDELLGLAAAASSPAARRRCPGCPQGRRAGTPPSWPGCRRPTSPSWSSSSPTRCTPPPPSSSSSWPPGCATRSPELKKELRQMVEAGAR